tara:strand:+ start:1286 stop:1573 length:288 start_codon:yes stop_codon:yes gene_type:complete
MNIKNLHEEDKGVSAKKISEKISSNATAIQILSGALLKEHITQTPAVLVCINGEVDYEDEAGLKTTLTSGDMHAIEPKLKHWVKGVQDSQLILLK